MTNIQVPAPIEEKIQKEYPTDTEGIKQFLLRNNIPEDCITDNLMQETARRNHLDRVVARQGYGLAWQWISVEERLPEWGEKVLVAIDTGEICDGWYSGSMKYFVVRGERFDKETSIGHYITHWMPLPQPPQQQPLK